MNDARYGDWSAVCDFDATISLTDTTDALLERFAGPAWREVEERWVRGEIGSAECMRRQVELLDVEPDALDAWLDEVKIDPHFKTFVQSCEQLGVKLRIASDGIDYIIHRVLRAHGLDHIPVHANRLVHQGGSRYELQSASASCASGSGNCKCAIIGQVRDEDAARRVFYVGDGRSDFCVSDKVDLVAAKASLLTYCREHSLPHFAFADFSDVSAILTRLVTRTAPRPAHTRHESAIGLA